MIQELNDRHALEALHGLGDHIGEIDRDADFHLEHPVDELLLVLDVIRNDMEDIIDAAADGIAGDHLGDRLDRFLEAREVPPGVALQRHRGDDELGLQQPRQVDFSAVLADVAGLLQVVQPFPAGAERQATCEARFTFLIRPFFWRSARIRMS
jgi:hypothetical protein